MFKVFDEPKLKSHKHKVFEVLDQEYNVPDLGPNKDPWATRRKLEKVFENDKIQQKGFGFSNTLIIDSDPEKVNHSDTVKNSIIVEPYTEEAVLHPEKDQSHEILFKAKDFLQ